MHPTPRQKLIELVIRYGKDLAEDPRRCEALLRDMCGGDQFKREINALVIVAKERIAPELAMTGGRGIPYEVIQQRAINRLHDDVGVRADLAKWGVESWALALGVVTMAQLAAGNVALTPVAVSLTGVQDDPLGVDTADGVWEASATDGEIFLRDEIRGHLEGHDGAPDAECKKEWRDTCRTFDIPQDAARQIFAMEEARFEGIQSRMIVQKAVEEKVEREKQLAEQEAVERRRIAAQEKLADDFRAIPVGCPIPESVHVDALRAWSPHFPSDAKRCGRQIFEAGNIKLVLPEGDELFRLQMVKALGDLIQVVSIKEENGAAVLILDTAAFRAGILCEYAWAALLAVAALAEIPDADIFKMWLSLKPCPPRAKLRVRATGT